MGTSKVSNRVMLHANGTKVFSTVSTMLVFVYFDITSSDNLVLVRMNGIELASTW